MSAVVLPRQEYHVSLGQQSSKARWHDSLYTRTCVKIPPQTPILNSANRHITTWYRPSTQYESPCMCPLTQSGWSRAGAFVMSCCPPIFSNFKGRGPMLGSLRNVSLSNPRCRLTTSNVVGLSISSPPQLRGDGICKASGLCYWSYHLSFICCTVVSGSSYAYVERGKMPDSL